MGNTIIFEYFVCNILRIPILIFATNIGTMNTFLRIEFIVLTMQDVAKISVICGQNRIQKQECLLCLKGHTT